MRVWLFRFIAISIPVVFFALLEAGLRLSGYGNDFPLFIENPANKHYVLPRPDLVKRYFAEDSAIPGVTMEANFLLKEKPANGLRFFVQGGSSAAGFPYGLGASLAGMLDQRLKLTYPDKHVEVVNTAMAAVNSYTMLDIADEIIEQQPDGILIYAGHNEYLGILGVGSNYTAANSQATTLLFLKLKDLRLFQLAQNVYHSFQTSEPAPDEQSQASRTFMAKVAKHKNIPQNSALYQAGVEQFRTNLTLLLEKYRRAKIPVFLATIASNIADQKPFSSETISPKLTKILANFDDVSRNSEDLALLQREARNSNNALLNFRVGQLTRTSDKPELAYEFFNRAKDLDLLRFRAPSETNNIIREATKADGVYLVDVEKRLRERSPQGSIGNNYMLEHLHLNVQGYFLLADTFYQSLKQHNLFGTWREIPTPHAWKMRPLLPSEEYNGFAKVQQLMADYPFTDQPSTAVLPRPEDWQQQLGKQYFEKKIDWLKMMQLSLRQYQSEKNNQMANKTLLLMAEALPHDPQINLAIAKGYSQGKQDGLAATYYKRAILAGNKEKTTRDNLVDAYRKSGQSELATYWQKQLNDG